MKVFKKAGKLVVVATAEELRKNPKLAKILKAQGMPPSVNPAAEAPGSDLGGGAGAELPTGGDDLGGVSDELGGVDAPTDGGVSDDLAGDPNEKFTSAVDKAYQDAFGKPMDEGMKQVLKGLGQMAQKSPVDDASTPGDPAADPAGDPLAGGDDLGGDPIGGAGGDPAASGAGAGGPPPAGTDLLAKSKGRLTRVASTSDWVTKLASKLAK